MTQDKKTQQEIDLIRNELDKELICYQMSWSDYSNQSKIMILGTIYQKEILLKLINLGFYYMDNTLMYDIEDKN
jgi:hypothetical protein